MRRAFAVMALCALPVSIVTVGLAGTASAATKATDSAISCSKLKANITGTTGTISKCSDTANTDGTGTFPVAALTSGSGKITWGAAHGTTAVSVTATSDPTGTDCAAGQDEYLVTGTTGKSTGDAKKSIAKDAAINATACVNGTTGAVTLAKGTDFTIAA
jgi:hypothetical protein